jgi:uncharacterized protein YggU (UPF0235/DUF167 family)
MGNLPWISVADGLRLTVRLTPKGGRDAIDGVGTLADGQAVLQARVRAAPSEGEANAALVGLIAKKLGVAVRAVRLEAGAGARLKRIKIEGDGSALAALLDRIVRELRAGARGR